MVSTIDVPNSDFSRLLHPYNATLITSRGRSGRANALAIAWIIPISLNPASLVFAIRPERHSYKLLEETGEFVVNIPSDNADLLKKLMITAKHFPPRVNELDEAGLTSIPSRKIRPPRIEECKAHFECKVDWMKDVGDHLLVVGNVVAVSIDGDCVTENDELIIDKLRPVHYLGKFYRTIFIGVGEIHDVER